MAQSITTTYAGEAAEQFLTRLIDTEDAIQKGLVYLHTGFNYKLTLPIMSISGDIVQDYSAEPSNVGTLTKTERAIELKDKTIYIDGLNPNQWRKDWQPFAPSPSAAFEYLENSEKVRAAFIERVVSTVANVNGYNLWQGDDVTTGATYNKFKGLLYRLQVNGAGLYTDVTATADTTYTASNVDDYLGKVWAEMIKRPKLASMGTKIICSYKTAGLYLQYLNGISGKGFTEGENAGINGLKYNGVPVVPSFGFPDNTLLCTYIDGGNPFKSNLHVGMRNVGDTMAFDFGKKANGSHNWFIRGDYSIGTAIGIYEDVILHQS